MKIVFALITVLLVAVILYLEKSGTVTPGSPLSSNERSIPAAPITKERAAAVIAELPEIKAWSDYIERSTEGKAHGAIMVSSEDPVVWEGKQYWPVNFYDNQPTHFDRWESFLVGLNAQDIVVDDLEAGMISLRQWRDSKKPMQRIQQENAR